MSQWQPIETLPVDDVRREFKRDGFDYGPRGGVTTGVLSGGELVLANYFIDPRAMLISGLPTHWRDPAPEPEKAA